MTNLEAHMERCINEIVDRQFEHEIVLDPFREFVLREQIRYMNLLIECGDDPERISEAEREFTETSIQRDTRLCSARVQTLLLRAYTVALGSLQGTCF